MHNSLSFVIWNQRIIEFVEDYLDVYNLQIWIYSVIGKYTIGIIYVFKNLNCKNWALFVQLWWWGFPQNLPLFALLAKGTRPGRPLLSQFASVCGGWVPGPVFPWTGFLHPEQMAPASSISKSKEQMVALGPEKPFLWSPEGRRGLHHGLGHRGLAGEGRRWAGRAAWKMELSGEVWAGMPMGWAFSASPAFWSVICRHCYL